MEKKLFLLLIGQDYSFLKGLEGLVQNIDYEVIASVPTIEQSEALLRSKTRIRSISTDGVIVTQLSELCMSNLCTTQRVVLQSLHQYLLSGYEFVL